MIKESLMNHCDWSIENYHDGKSFRVNYLKENASNEIEELNEKNLGSTYIFRFYK